MGGSERDAKLDGCQRDPPLQDCVFRIVLPDVGDARVIGGRLDQFVNNVVNDVVLDRLLVLGDGLADKVRTASGRWGEILLSIVRNGVIRG